jgi:hypothetical protein
VSAEWKNIFGPLVQILITSPFNADCHEMWHNAKESSPFSSKLNPALSLRHGYSLEYGSYLAKNVCFFLSAILLHGKWLTHCFDKTAIWQGSVMLTDSLYRTKQSPGMSNTPVVRIRLNVCIAELRDVCTTCKRTKLVRERCADLPNIAFCSPEVNIIVPSVISHFRFWIHKICNNWTCR